MVVSTDLENKCLTLLIWHRISQFLGGMPWKTKGNQFVTVTLLKSHSGVKATYIVNTLNYNISFIVIS